MNTEIREPSNTGVKRIVKIVIVAAVVVVVGLTILYTIYQKIEWHPALKLTISTGVNETDGFPIVTNATFEQTSVIYKGTDSKVIYPDISVIARKNSLLAAPASHWASVQWDPEEGNGTHTMIVTFRDSYIPQEGDLLILTVRMTGARGFILTKKTVLYEWN